MNNRDSLLTNNFFLWTITGLICFVIAVTLVLFRYDLAPPRYQTEPATDVTYFNTV